MVKIFISSERLESFYNIFRKNDNINSYKKPRLHPHSKRYIFQKNTWVGGQIDSPSYFRVKSEKVICS